jgi:hypothetical protein
MAGFYHQQRGLADPAGVRALRERHHLPRRRLGRRGARPGEQGVGVAAVAR